MPSSDSDHAAFFFVDAQVRIGLPVQEEGGWGVVEGGDSTCKGLFSLLPHSTSGDGTDGSREINSFRKGCGSAK